MSEEDWYGDPEYMDDFEEDLNCFYGFEFCIDPTLRNMGNCFECELMLESFELQCPDIEEEIKNNEA